MYNITEYWTFFMAGYTYPQAIENEHLTVSDNTEGKSGSL